MGCTFPRGVVVGPCGDPPEAVWQAFVASGRSSTTPYSDGGVFFSIPSRAKPSRLAPKSFRRAVAAAFHPARTEPTPSFLISAAEPDCTLSV